MKGRAALAVATILAVPALSVPAAIGAATAPKIAAPPKEVRPREAVTIGRPQTAEQGPAAAATATAEPATAPAEDDDKEPGVKPDANPRGDAGEGAGEAANAATNDPAPTTDQPQEQVEEQSEMGSLIMRDPAGPDIVAREIVFLTRASDADQDAMIAENRFTLIGRDRLESLGLVMVTARLAVGDDRETAIAALSSDSRIAWAQPNHIYWLLSGEGASEGGGTSSRDRGLAMHGLASERSAVGGTIAVIDGPVDMGNPDLAGARISEELFGEDGTPSAHGTAIAEILVGTGNFKGVAQGAQLLSLPAFRPVGVDGWQSTTRHVARALERAVTARPQVLNLSFGTKKIDRTARELLDMLEANGTCVAAAAGNGGGAVLFPGSLDQTVAVTAVDGSRALYPYASRGPEVDVAAWGVTMSAAVPGGRRTVSGTSFATAVVAGSMMHMPACNGAANPQAMRNALQQDALDLGDSGPDALFGAGLFTLGAVSTADVPADPAQMGGASDTAQGAAAGESGSSVLLWALPLALLGLLIVFFLWRRRKAENSPPA